MAGISMFQNRKASSNSDSKVDNGDRTEESPLSEANNSNDPSKDADAGQEPEESMEYEPEQANFQNDFTMYHHQFEMDSRPSTAGSRPSTAGSEDHFDMSAMSYGHEISEHSMDFSENFNVAAMEEVHSDCEMESTEHNMATNSTIDNRKAGLYADATVEQNESSAEKNGGGSDEATVSLSLGSLLKKRREGNGEAVQGTQDDHASGLSTRPQTEGEIESFERGSEMPKAATLSKTSSFTKGVRVINDDNVASYASKKENESLRNLMLPQATEPMQCYDSAENQILDNEPNHHTTDLEANSRETDSNRAEYNEIAPASSDKRLAKLSTSAAHTNIDTLGIIDPEFQPGFENSADYSSIRVMKGSEHSAPSSQYAENPLEHSLAQDTSAKIQSADHNGGEYILSNAESNQSKVNLNVSNGDEVGEKARPASAIKSFAKSNESIKASSKVSFQSPIASSAVLDPDTHSVLPECEENENESHGHERRFTDVARTGSTPNAAASQNIGNPSVDKHTHPSASRSSGSGTTSVDGGQSANDKISHGVALYVTPTSHSGQSRSTQHLSGVPSKPHEAGVGPKPQRLFANTKTSESGYGQKVSTLTAASARHAGIVTRPYKSSGKGTSEIVQSRTSNQGRPQISSEKPNHSSDAMSLKPSVSATRPSAQQRYTLNRANNTRKPLMLAKNDRKRPAMQLTRTSLSDRGHSAAKPASSHGSINTSSFQASNVNAQNKVKVTPSPRQRTGAEALGASVPKSVYAEQHQTAKQIDGKSFNATHVSRSSVRNFQNNFEAKLGLEARHRYAVKEARVEQEHVSAQMTGTALNGNVSNAIELNGFAQENGDKENTGNGEARLYAKDGHEEENVDEQDPKQGETKEEREHSEKVNEFEKYLADFFLDRQLLEDMTNRNDQELLHMEVELAEVHSEALGIHSEMMGLVDSLREAQEKVEDDLAAAERLLA